MMLSGPCQCTTLCSHQTATGPTYFMDVISFLRHAYSVFGDKRRGKAPYPSYTYMYKYKGYTKSNKVL